MTQRERFEHYWIATRGPIKAYRHLRRWHKDPDVYMGDAVNRHWVTWQAAAAA